MLVPSTTLFRSHPARSRVARDTGIDKARCLALPCAQHVVASRCAAVSDAQKAEMIGPTAEAVPGTMFRDQGADDVGRFLPSMQPGIDVADDGLQRGRSEERRGGKECVSTCRSRWSPNH